MSSSVFDKNVDAISLKRNFLFVKNCTQIGSECKNTVMRSINSVFNLHREQLLFGGDETHFPSTFSAYETGSGDLYISRIRRLRLSIGTFTH